MNILEFHSKIMNMKKSLTILVCFLSSGILVAQDMTLDEILKKYFKVNGGDKLENIQTYKAIGKIYSGAEMKMTGFAKRPDMERIEMDLQGTRITVVITGQTGWMINQISGPYPQDLDAAMIKNSKKMFGSEKSPFGWKNPFVKSEENGNRIELVGRETMEGTQVYNLKITFKNDEVANYYMDAEKFMILKVKEKSMIQGQLIEVEEIFSDYRDVDGVKIPHRLETFHNGSSTYLTTFDKIEFNLQIDDAEFKKPVSNKK
jgi:outer membrane lipoprotein-sorting protein